MTIRMCFFGGGKQQDAPEPAAAPGPPSPTATPGPVGTRRREDDLALFGTQQPSLRVDRSATSGGVGKGGSGVSVT